MKFITPEEYAAAHDPEVSEAEAFEERAAILEFQAGFDRKTAEAMARPMADKWMHNHNLYVLRMNARALAAKKRKGTK
jgi:hypothetical protein